MIIINDATRSTSTQAILHSLWNGGEIGDAEIIVATGAHKAPTEAELRQLLGPFHHPLGGRVRVHDSVKDGFVQIGYTRRGSRVLVNELISCKDKIIAISSVEPHYFAGYTGGRKSIVPGIASYKTIEDNHKWAISHEAQPLSLEGNPVHEDLEESVAMMDKDIFSVIVVQDGTGKICYAEAGDIFKTLRHAAAFAKEIYTPQIQEKADVVITAANYPLDIDLYQAQKAIENVKFAVKEGGIIILVSSCREGIGPRYYAETLQRLSTEGIDEKEIFENYRLGYHKPVRMARMLQGFEIWGVTEVPSEAMRKASIRPFSILQNAVDEALKLKGRDSSWLVVPKGSVTVPRVSCPQGAP